MRVPMTLSDLERLDARGPDSDHFSGGSQPSYPTTKLDRITRVVGRMCF